MSGVRASCGVKNSQRVPYKTYQKPGNYSAPKTARRAPRPLRTKEWEHAIAASGKRESMTGVGRGLEEAMEARAKARHEAAADAKAFAVPTVAPDGGRWGSRGARRGASGGSTHR